MFFKWFCFDWVDDIVLYSSRVLVFLHSKALNESQLSTETNREILVVGRTWHGKTVMFTILDHWNPNIGVSLIKIFEQNTVIQLHFFCSLGYQLHYSTSIQSKYYRIVDTFEYTYTCIQEIMPVSQVFATPPIMLGRPQYETVGIRCFSLKRLTPTYMHAPLLDCLVTQSRQVSSVCDHHLSSESLTPFLGSISLKPDVYCSMSRRPLFAKYLHKNPHQTHILDSTLFPTVFVWTV